MATTVSNRLVCWVSCCGSFKWVLWAAALEATEFPACLFSVEKTKRTPHLLEVVCPVATHDGQTAKKEIIAIFAILNE